MTVMPIRQLAELLPLVFLYCGADEPDRGCGDCVSGACCSWVRAMARIMNGNGIRKDCPDKQQLGLLVMLGDAVILIIPSVKSCIQGVTVYLVDCQ